MANNRKGAWHRLKQLAFLLVLLSHIPTAYALFEDKEKEALKAKAEQLQKELANVTSDRDNILRQAKNFLKEKEEAAQKVEDIKSSGAKTEIEVNAARKESEILKSELERMKTARNQDAENFRKDKQAMETRIADLEARANSLAHTMEEYTPDKIQQLVADRNRLEEETKRMAGRIIDSEKQMQEIKKKLAPFELDREELNRLRMENKEMQKRMRYVSQLEKRQQQLIKENAENREKTEVLKAKFKEAVPGLAKSSRISQKMMRENADMHYNLGTIFLQNKQYREAIREYEQVLELRPNDPETHYNLGVLYDDYQRDREKALYHYQKYLAINPKSPDAKKVETYILSLELEQKVR